MADPSKGYLLLWRDIMDNPLWNDGRPFSQGQAWIQILLWAEFKSDKQIINGQLVSLKPGEFCMSQREMAESMNWTQSTLNRWLKKLVTLNQVCIKHESRTTHVSVVNWGDRQIAPRDLVRNVNQTKARNSTRVLGSTYSSTSTNSTKKNNKRRESKYFFKDLNNKTANTGNGANGNTGNGLGKSEILKTGICTDCGHKGLHNFSVGSTAKCGHCQEYSVISMVDYKYELRYAQEQQRKDEKEYPKSEAGPAQPPAGSGTATRSSEFIKEFWPSSAQQGSGRGTT
jgi:hypothetical protein